MSCSLSPELRTEQNKLVDMGWKALASTGLNPYDWMLMSWKRTNNDWSGDTLFSFKHATTRLYVYIPSKWAGVDL